MELNVAIEERNIKVDRKFRDVIRKIVKHLKKGLKSILDRVHISKDEGYEINFRLFM